MVYDIKGCFEGGDSSDLFNEGDFSGGCCGVSGANGGYSGGDSIMDTVSSSIRNMNYQLGGYYVMGFSLVAVLIVIIMLLALGWYFGWWSKAKSALGYESFRTYPVKVYNN